MDSDRSPTRTGFRRGSGHGGAPGYRPGPGRRWSPGPHLTTGRRPSALWAPRSRTSLHQSTSIPVIKDDGVVHPQSRAQAESLVQCGLATLLSEVGPARRMRSSSFRGFPVVCSTGQVLLACGKLRTHLRRDRTCEGWLTACELQMNSGPHGLEASCRTFAPAVIDLWSGRSWVYGSTRS